MSKIAEQKALEAYPIIEGNSIDWGQYEDLNEDTREAYIVGYDKAMQDFLEKSCEYLRNNLGNYFNGKKQFVEQFKNYMQDEM